jgi:hypothetical protein
LELRYEEAFVVLQDVAQGIECIESAMEPFISEVVHNNIDTLRINIKEKLGKIIDSNEQERYINSKIQISEEILPTFIDWKEEIEKVLKPYIVS